MSSHRDNMLDHSLRAGSKFEAAIKFAEASDWQTPFRGGELYLDTEKKLYKSLGNGQLRRGSLLWFLNPWSVIWKHGKWAKEECGITKSNLKVCVETVAPANKGAMPLWPALPQSERDKLALRLWQRNTCVKGSYVIYLRYLSA